MAWANDIIERVFVLDNAVANARAFRALLENLHSRDLSVVQEPHVTAIIMVRAGILRSLILSVTACLDPEDRRRDNRASIGQILKMLEDDAVVRRFPDPGQSPGPALAALARARRDYQALLDDDLWRRARKLRNDAIAHLLISEGPAPGVAYETIYALHDVAERLVTSLYHDVCCRGVPTFLEHQARSTEHAEVFWATYFKGMGFAGSTIKPS